MLKKTLSLLVILGLMTTNNFFVLAQSLSSEVKNSQQANVSFKEKTLLLKLGVNPAERANELLDKDSFLKVKEDSVSKKAMQDADNAQQNKKSEGIGKTTAIVIGAALAAAIIIVVATRGSKERHYPPPYCDPGPCFP
jgi:hypothetical protein